MARKFNKVKIIKDLGILLLSDLTFYVHKNTIYAKGL